MTDQTLEPSAARALVLAAASLLALFAIGVLGGYVFAHDPLPAEVRVHLEAATPSADHLISGTIRSVAPGAIEISTATGSERFPLADGAPIEELAPLAGPIPDGTSVQANAGGNRTDSGFVLSGIVFLEGVLP